MSLFGGTHVVVNDPAKIAADLARQQIEWHRQSYFSRLTDELAMRPDCIVEIDKKSLDASSWLIAMNAQDERRPRYKHTNCPNCAAPSEPGRCSYCLTPTETL